MDRVGYDLFPVTIPKGIPWYLASAMTSAQSVLDDEYKHGPGGLDNFYDQAESWLTTQAMKRGSNRAYTPDPFPMAIPQRKVVVVSDDGLSFVAVPQPLDLAIQMPVLAPLPADKPPTPTFPHPVNPVDPAEIKAALDRIEKAVNQILGIVGGVALGIGGRQGSATQRGQ